MLEIIKGIKVEGIDITGFSESITEYTVEVPKGITDINVEVVLNDPKSISNVIGNQKILENEDTTIIITASDINGRTVEIHLNVVRYDKKSDTSIVELTIHEGRNHQVKKMFEAIGYKVSKLKREEFAFLNLNGLTPGKWRRLNFKEVKKLYNLTK